MSKSRPSKQATTKCARCKEPLTTFMAYISGEGDVCLKCFSEYAQAEDNLLITRSKDHKEQKG